MLPLTRQVMTILRDASATSGRTLFYTPRSTGRTAVVNMAHHRARVSTAELLVGLTVVLTVVGLFVVVIALPFAL